MYTVKMTFNKFTSLLIRHFHVRAGHQGRELVVNVLRQKYRILSMRSAVKNVWNSCQICKVLKVEPQHPKMAPLPICRLQIPPRPFYFTAVDYFGPFYVHFRTNEKRYVVIFTCLSTRAIHLEISSSLSTDSVVMAI